MGIVADELEILEFVVEQAGRASFDGQLGPGPGLPGKLGQDNLSREMVAVQVQIAKGVDEIARAIRERAAEHGIPLHSDPPTARAIHASVEIGQEISVDHYRAVAAAIRFADAMRKRARRR